MRALLDRLGWRGWVLPLTLLVLAEVAMRINPVESDALARPTDVLNALAQAIANGSVLSLSAQTLAAALAGLALGGGLGLAAGIWFGLSRSASDAAALPVELLRPVPSVALIPLSMLVFGFGFRMEIAVIAFTCFWPMLLLSQAAVRNVEPRLLEVARVLGFAWWERVLKLVLPAALPRIFVAFRLCVGIALVVAVTTEIAANPIGLGYAIISAGLSLRPEVMYAFLIWLAILGWLLNAGLIALHHRLFGAAYGEVAA